MIDLKKKEIYNMNIKLRKGKNKVRGKGEKKMESRMKQKKSGKLYIRNKNAITLIALVITIILLLILAGVVINFVINGGIIDKARTSNR